MLMLEYYIAAPNSLILPLSSCNPFTAEYYSEVGKLLNWKKMFKEQVSFKCLVHSLINLKKRCLMSVRY